MTIPKLTPYAGQVANPDGSQTQTEFTTNMFGQLSYEAQLATELDATIDGMNQAVTDVESSANAASASATAAEAAASTAGYQGLWPDTGGSALKGETWQTQVGGTPTGEYYTALQNTTVDPVGDNVNWTELVTPSYIESVTTVFVESEGLGGIVDDTSVFQAAIDKASALQYVKRGVKILLKAPEKYYQLSGPLNFNELWNVVFECEVKNAWNRSESGDVETTGGNIHWIGNTTDSLFNFGQYCFGIQFKNIVVNGRDNLKLAYDMTRATPSVLRDYTFYDCGALNCDFGTVHGDISGTDLAPVLWVNPIFSKNKSAAVLNNSGNAQVTLIGGFITNNGYAPSVGNSFIPDADNLGFQVLHRAGHCWLDSGVVLDGASPNLPASGENIRCSGGTMHAACWDDTPEVISVNITGTCQSFHFGKFRHFDGAMTKLNTPTSIKHNANCTVDFHAGVNVFGDVEINSGAKAGGIANGVNFLNPTSGFTGNGHLGLAGFSQDDNTGDTTLHIGGTEIFPGGDAAPSKMSVYSRPNRPVLAAKTSSAGSTLVSFNLKDNGQWEILTNIWYDTSTNEYKSITSGNWARKLMTSTGVEQMNYGTAASANEVLSFSISFGSRKGVGGNGKFVMELSDNQLGFEQPASGQVNRGSIYFNPSPTAGGYVGVGVTLAGTVGVDAVFKQFGTYEA